MVSGTQITFVQANFPPPPPSTEFNVVSDKEMRPRECVGCGSNAIINRGPQFHDMQDLGTPTIKSVLRHEKITWECKQASDKEISENILSENARNQVNN